MRIIACTVLAAALASTACTRRDAPYHFRAPLVSSVRADHRPGAPPPATARDGRRTTPARRDPARTWLSAPAHAQGQPGAEAASLTSGAVRPSAVPQALRALAGSAATGTGSASFALAALAELGAHLDARVRRATSGAHVLDLGRDRGAVLTGEAPLTGDLAVLTGSGGAGSDEDLLLAIVVMPAGDGGAVELVYAEDGTVRRGLVPARGCRDRQAMPAAAQCLGKDRVRAFLALDRLAP